MTRYMQLEHTRLQADIEALDQRLATTKRGPGLRTRSVNSFLSQLRRHKREMLKDLDVKLAANGATH
jgi:hypothetical protein